MSKLWRYDLPSINGEGWAVIVLGSDGFFAAVSDFGNYAFRWFHHGRTDFREFFVRKPEYWESIMRKIAREEYDGDATALGIRRHILEYRRERQYSKEEARREWDLLRCCNGVAHEMDFYEWYQDTEIGDASEMRVDSLPGDAKMFAQKVLPRLAEVLRAELAAESNAA